MKIKKSRAHKTLTEELKESAPSKPESNRILIPIENPKAFLDFTKRDKEVVMTGYLADSECIPLGSIVLKEKTVPLTNELGLTIERTDNSYTVWDRPKEVRFGSFTREQFDHAYGNAK